MNSEVEMGDTNDEYSNGRWEQIGKLLRRRGPFTGPNFEPDTPQNPQTLKLLREYAKILVIGAGGLGCELLKDLALMGFRNLDVIDMDTIDATNLNRQFLFRKADIGRPKAEVAAAFINKRVPGANVQPFFCKIQDKDQKFYRQYPIIVCGLDSIEARRWMNATLANMVEYVSKGEDEEMTVDETSIIPLVDGGTEGLKGQCRVMYGKRANSSCFECSLDSFPADPMNFPMCTLANTPRIPEHCIEYVFVKQWDDEKPFKDSSGNPVKLDKDDPEHMKWIFEMAKKRADHYKIKGVTYRLTQGVVKRIIPAVASTNAIIAAACANEVFKIATDAGRTLDNYMMYMGDNGIYTHTFQYEKKQNCSVCGTPFSKLRVNPEISLEQFLKELRDNSNYQLKRPSIRCNGKNVRMQAPPQLEKLTRANLEKGLSELIEGSGNILTVTDPCLPSCTLEIQVDFDPNVPLPADDEEKQQQQQQEQKQQ